MAKAPKDMSDKMGQSESESESESESMSTDESESASADPKAAKKAPGKKAANPLKKWANT